ncbi:RteC domain-containing protein [Pseudochryseolinea flava]|nr:RteC domain-containing protein [Pseudochryseolinea flava]
MKILKFCDALEARMKSELSGSDTARDYASVALVYDKLNSMVMELREFVVRTGFSDREEEIQFFKFRKPIFMSQQIYHKKLFKLLVQKSFRSFDEQKKLVQDVRNKLEQFAVQNFDFYCYCMGTASHLDAQYFSMQLGADGQVDPFCTRYDLKLSKLLANNMLLEYLNGVDDKRTTSSANLRWTGSKSALVELVYALHLVGVFNNATADIVNIADELGGFFGMDLKNYRRIFIDIKGRKTGQFLVDRMQRNFHERIAEHDGG